MNSPSSNIPSQPPKKTEGAATGAETSGAKSADAASPPRSTDEAIAKSGDKSSETSTASASSAGSSAKAAGAKKESGGKDAIELLTADHREVDQLFEQYQSSKGRQQRKKLIEKIAAALTAHTIIEEEIFYPACREHGVEEDELDEAQVEHDTVKVLVSDLMKSAQDDDYYDAKVTVLSEYVKHHVKEEEDPKEGIFARARKADIDLDGLGKKLEQRKDKLMSDTERLLASPPKIQSLNLSQLNQEYGEMARYPTDRYRDEDSSRSGGYRSAGRSYGGVDYDDEDRGSGISRGSRSEFYRGGNSDYDEDYGPNRGAYGQSDYSRSSQGYRGDSDRGQGYRGGFSSSEGGYGRNSGSGFGGQRGDYSGQAFGTSGASYDRGRSGSGSGGRRIEQSASGGRYRLDYEQDDEDYGDSQGGGRYLGASGEDREYYQGTRYGSSYRGGRSGGYQSEDDRYRTEDDNDGGYSENAGRNRYYSGQGYGSTRGGDYGGQNAYGSGYNSDSDEDFDDDRGNNQRGGSSYSTGDYRRRSGSSSSSSGRGGYEGSGSGFRGNR